MLESGVARPSSNPYSNPLHIVRKKSGEWRPCGDYRRSNAATVPDRYPLPHLTAHLSGSTILAKIDIVKSYHEIPVAEEDVEKTAVATRFGLFEFPKMIFWTTERLPNFPAIYRNGWRAGFCRLLHR